MHKALIAQQAIPHWCLETGISSEIALPWSGITDVCPSLFLLEDVTGNTVFIA